MLHKSLTNSSLTRKSLEQFCITAGKATSGDYQHSCSISLLEQEKCSNSSWPLTLLFITADEISPPGNHCVIAPFILNSFSLMPALIFSFFLPSFFHFSLPFFHSLLSPIPNPASLLPSLPSFLYQN